MIDIAKSMVSVIIYLIILPYNYSAKIMNKMPM